MKKYVISPVTLFDADENPDQLYKVLFVYPAWEQKFKDGSSQVYEEKADIQALNSTLTFVPINSVFTKDLVIVNETI